MQPASRDGLNLKSLVCFFRMGVFLFFLLVANTLFDWGIIRKSFSRLLISLLYLKAVYTCCEKRVAL